jgi:hypothetical protein
VARARRAPLTDLQRVAVRLTSAHPGTFTDVWGKRAHRKQVACPTCCAHVRVGAGAYFAVRDTQMTMIENGKVVHACNLPPRALHDRRV